MALLIAPMRQIIKKLGDSRESPLRRGGPNKRLSAHETVDTAFSHSIALKS